MSELKKEDYWVKIAGNSLIVMASEIISINVMHASPSALQDDVEVKRALAAALRAMEQMKKLLQNEQSS